MRTRDSQRWLLANSSVVGFGVAADSALVVVLASVRKDGIALFTSEEATVAALSPLEVLVAVYLAGVLLPCLVTAFTIAREISARYAAKPLPRSFSPRCSHGVVRLSSASSEGG